MKVVLHYAAGPGLTRRVAEIERQQGLRVAICPVADRARYRTAMADAEVLWHLLDPVTEAVLEGAPALRLVQKIGVGVNTIDLDAARRRGVAVCNMPGTNTQAVAEMTLLLILAALRRVARLDAATRAGEGWRQPVEAQDRYGEVSGRTIGLVGYGAVPRRLAPVLAAMGARVLFASRSLQPEAVGERRSLDDLLRESDVVSLHLPLAADTERLIDAAAIARMKRGAVLVNTARGALVDESALIDAIRRGHLGGAGLDVFEAEPVPPDSPLLDLDNVVVTPHVAWLTQETMERSLAVAAENCRRLGAREELLHRVA